MCTVSVMVRAHYAPVARAIIGIGIGSVLLSGTFNMCCANMSSRRPVLLLNLRQRGESSEARLSLAQYSVARRSPLNIA